MSETILIIGAGIAGLAAGCYAQMNGYRSKIFELHDIPGGLCTAWERQDYIFDGCIHYLFGSAAGQPFSNLWQELGAIQGRRMIHHEEFMRVTAPDGRTLIGYCDPDRLESHLKVLSPGDQKVIEEFAQGIRVFKSFDMSQLSAKPRSLMKPRDGAVMGKKMLPFVLPLARWGLLSARDFANRFKDPFLRRAVALMFAWEQIPLMAGLSLLAYMHQGNAGFPGGGSLEFARAIERRYLELGGEILYKSQVEKILVESTGRGGEDRATGVRLYNDAEYQGDYIISAADGRATIYDMLAGRYTNRKTDNYYDVGNLPIHSIVQVSFGVNRDLSQEPHWVTYLLDQPVIIAGREQREIGVKHYCFDASLAPAGKSAIEVMLPSDYGYWQRIYGRKLYDTEQIQVANLVIEQLEKIYPGIREQIEVTDVATPLSYERYTGNWQGSTCGWLLTRQTMKLMLRGMSKTLPRLKNFYMAGQWVEPGGSVPLAAQSARNVIQLICHADGREFTTSLPSA
jgi:phytoene dehydrogenase-like protein